MNIGIIGSGHIGATAVKPFADANHEVVLGNSRGPESLASLVEELGPQARAASVEIVVDAMNYYARRDGEIDFSGLPERRPQAGAGISDPQRADGPGSGAREAGRHALMRQRPVPCEPGPRVALSKR